MSSRRAIGVAAVTCLLAAAVWLHVPRLNGPPYWPWEWMRRPNVLEIAACFTLAALPALAALFVRRPAAAVALAALSAVALQLAATSLTGVPPATRVTRLITDPAVTSYYTAGVQVLELQQRRPDVGLVKNFDRFLQFFPLHARTKPLLPVFVYTTLVRLFGADAPVAAATLIALLTAAWIPVMFSAVRRMTDAGTAVIACVLLALMPSVAIFFPQPDVTYPLFACGVLATWPFALRGSKTAAAAFGLIVFAMSLTSYALLVIGAFCVLLAVFECVRTGEVRRVVVAGLIAVGVIAAAYGLLAVATGYPALAAFSAALAQQHVILRFLHRPYPGSIPWDFADFALGLGWAPLLAALLFVARRERSPLTPVVWAGLLTAPVIALTGLMQAENARVWIFLMPLVALPAAAELARWQRAGRVLVAFSMVLVTIALYVNILFVFYLAPHPLRPIPAAAFP